MLFFASLPIAVALLAADFVPLVEYPARLGVAEELRRLLFETNAGNDLTFAPQPWPGFFVPLLWALLGELIGIDLAGRLLLVFAVVSTPAAIALLLRRLGRPRWIALGALPLLVGPALMLGYVEFIVALPLLAVSLAFVLDSAGDRRIVVAATATVLLFAVHWLACGLFVLVALPLLCAGPDAVERRELRGCAIGLVAGLLPTMLPWLGRMGEVVGPCDSPACRWFAIGRTPEMVAQQRVADLLDLELLAPGYHWIVIAIAALIASSAFLAAEGHLRRVRWLRAAPFVALVVVAVVPDRFAGGDGNVLMATLALSLLCLPLASIDPEQPRQRWLLVGLFAIVSLESLLFAWQVDRLQTRFRPLAAMLRAVPRGAGVLALPQRSRQRCHSRGLLYHARGFAAARGAKTNLELLARSGSWLRYSSDSERRPLARPPCAAEGGAPLTVDRLDEPEAAAFPYALVAKGADLSQRGIHRPLMVDRGLVLYGRATKPVVVLDTKSLGALCRRTLAPHGTYRGCRQRLLWDDAARTCVGWGGHLSIAGPGRISWPRDRWRGIRIFRDGGVEFEEVPDHKPAQPTSRCVFARATEPRVAAVPCGVEAHALCRIRPETRAPQGKRWRARQLVSGHIVSRAAMSYRAARKFCKRWRAEPVQAGDDERVFFEYRLMVHALPSPVWLGKRTPRDAKLPPVISVCGTAGRGYDLCSNPHPFLCRRRARP